MSPDNASLTVKNLTITFSRWGQAVTALDHLNMLVPQGQWVMLVGQNGSGKTTLLRAISGQAILTTGEICINGQSLNRLSSSQVADRVFHVHQDPLLGTAPTLTLYENLLVADHVAQNSSMSRKELSEKYYELLRPLNLSNRLKQLARYLSGGERQLLALLVARLRPSSLLLLDEPLAALDPAKTELCIEQIRALKEEGKTILQVTHDPGLSVSEGDRTIVLRHGKIVYDEVGERRDSRSVLEAWIHDANRRKVA